MKAKKKQHYDETYGSKPPQNYEQFFVPAIGKPVAKDLIRLAALRPGERVLDAACGTGIIARLALQQVGDSGTVTGLDINQGMLAVARSVTPPDKAIKWYEASAEAMPLPDEAFDVVLCQMGLQFMEDKPAALSEMRRVLVTGGRLMLNVPGPAGDAFEIFAEMIGQHISPKAAGFVSHVFSLHDTAELQELIHSAGFHEIDIKAKNKMLSLPAPKDFLWQYIYSTPLAGIVTKADEEAYTTLEHEVTEKWQDFVDDGTFLYEQRIVTVNARK